MKVRTTAAFLSLLLIEGTVAAQEPRQIEPETVVPPHWHERLATAPEVAAAPPFEAGPNHFVSAQVLLGFETGVRLQYTFHRECNREWVGELFLGAAGTRYGASGALGIGGRVHCALASGSWGDHLIVSPGLNLVFLGEESSDQHPWNQPEDAVTFLAPSVDIAWLHDFLPHFGLELGVHLGLGIGLDGTDSDGDSAAGEFTPLFSVFAGVRF
jgi:hypothetical protein